MPASESERIGYLTLALTGLVSLVVGVASGLILNFATSKRPGLEYEVLSSEVFSGPVTNLAILAIVVRNTGTDGLDDMNTRIDLKNAELKEHKVVGLPPSAYSASVQPSSLVIDVPYFNPDDSASIQLLVALNSTDFESPSIDVRAMRSQHLHTSHSQTVRKRIPPVDHRSEKRYTLIQGCSAVS